MVLEMLVMAILVDHPSQLLPAQSHEQSGRDVVALILQEESHQKQPDTLEEFADKECSTSVHEPHLGNLVAKLVEILCDSLCLLFCLVIGSQIHIIGPDEQYFWLKRN